MSTKSRRKRAGAPASLSLRARPLPSRREAPAPPADAPAPSAVAVLPTLDCAVKWRILTAPEDYGPLADFSCGKRGGQAEREVNRTVGQLFASSEAGPLLVVVLEKAEGCDEFGRSPLVGVCALASLQSEGIFGLPDGTGMAYVAAIGTDAIYRDHVLDDGATRCGSALLVGAMVVARTMFGDEMPPVLAKVLPRNRGGMRLFNEHGFDNLGLREGASTMLRPRHLAPDFRR